jgi:hypothetical protein
MTFSGEDSEMKRHSKLPILFDPLSRRMFLRGMGGVLAIPFLPSLLPRAEAATIPSSFVFTSATHGRWHGAWYPNGVPLTDVGNGVRATKLANISSPLGRVFGRDFDDIRSKVNIIQGLDYQSASGHDQPIYTASNTVRTVDGDPHNFDPIFPYTIDAVLAKSKTIYPSRPKLDVLRLSPRSNGSSFNDPVDGMNANGFANYLPVYGASLNQVFNYLNGFFTAGSTPVSSGPSPQMIQRRFLVDSVLAEFKSATASSKMSSKDKVSLQNYVDQMTDVQRDLASMPLPTTTGPTCQPLAAMSETTDNVVFNQRMIDMMVLALSCGITRIATYNLNWNACATVTGAPDYHNTSDGVHFCHTSGFDSVADWNKMQMQHYGYIVRKMDQMGILDNSIVVYANDMSSSTPNHHGLDIPVVTAGSLGGKFKTGELISYYNTNRLLGTLNGMIQNADGTRANGAYNIYGGRRWNELLVSIFAAAGVSPSEFQRDGVTGFGSGVCTVPAGQQAQCGSGVNSGQGDTWLANLMTQYYRSTYTNPMGATLPYLYG